MNGMHLKNAKKNTPNPRAESLSQFEPRGDGTFNVKWISFPAPGEWLTVREAAKGLKIRPCAVRVLLGELLVYRRPTQSRYEISGSSVKTLRAALAADPQFMRSPARAALAKQVEIEMRNLIEDAMQALDKDLAR